MKQVSFWYCFECDEEVCSENVTYSEKHDRCGSSVEWITVNIPETKKEDEE